MHRELEFGESCARQEQGTLRPERAQERTELVEPPADDHAASRVRANATNASATRVRARPAAVASEISRVASRPCDPSLGESAGREVGLDRRARDERDAIAGFHGPPNRLLQAEVETDAEVAQPDALTAQAVLDDLPDSAPSCMRISVSSRSSSSVTARFAKG